MGSTSNLTEELTVGSLKYWFVLASSLNDSEPLGDQTLDLLGLEESLCTASLEHHLLTPSFASKIVSLPLLRIQ